MEIALHQIEPWLIKHQFAKYNLGESGVANQTVRELLLASGGSLEDLADVSLANSDTRGDAALRAAVAELYPGAGTNEVLVTTGTSEALWIYFQLRYRPGANVVVPVPAFQSLVEVPRYIGYEVRELSLEDRDGFRPDLYALARLVDERTVAIVINTPQNPTGIVFTDAEIGEFARIADSVGAELLADEHYRFIPHNGVQLIPSVYGRVPNVIATGSMIKCFGCVGLRVGWLLGPGPFIDACRNLKDYTTHTLCAMVELLALRTLQARGVLARRYTEWARANVAAFGALVARHSHVLAWIPPQAGLVGFPRLLTADITSSGFCVDLFEQTGVFVLPGEPFGRTHHFRVGFGLSPEDFGVSMERFDRYLSERFSA